VVPEDLVVDQEDHQVLMLVEQVILLQLVQPKVKMVV
tara:strand:+ start:60 stop:170 length:111 start_codon:yes stop_codon:yes gene_type:complete